MIIFVNTKRIMKKKTQNRLIAWMIWFMQWVCMAAALISLILFFAGSGLIGLFCAFLMLICSIQLHKWRVEFFKEYTGIQKTVDFIEWVSTQNRKTRRYYGRKIKKSLNKHL